MFRTEVDARCRAETTLWRKVLNNARDPATLLNKQKTSMEITVVRSPSLINGRYETSFPLSRFQRKIQTAIIFYLDPWLRDFSSRIFIENMLHERFTQLTGSLASKYGSEWYRSAKQAAGWVRTSSKVAASLSSIFFGGAVTEHSKEQFKGSQQSVTKDLL